MKLLYLLSLAAFSLASTADVCPKVKSILSEQLGVNEDKVMASYSELAIAIYYPG